MTQVVRSFVGLIAFCVACGVTILIVLMYAPEIDNFDFSKWKCKGDRAALFPNECK